MTPIIHYTMLYKLLLDKMEEKKVWKHVAKYIMIYRKLYNMGKASLMLRFLGREKSPWPS